MPRAAQSQEARLRPLPSPCGDKKCKCYLTRATLLSISAIGTALQSILFFYTFVGDEKATSGRNWR